MLKMKLTLGTVAILLSFGLVSTAFAGEVNVEPVAAIGTEAGNWEYNFDAPETKADQAAKNYQYNRETLAAIGTEAGNWEYNFDAPETKADRVARSYQYDQEALAGIGTEAGNWEYRFASPESKSGEAVAAEGSDALCSDC